LKDLCAPAPLGKRLVGVRSTWSRKPGLDGARHLILPLTRVGVRPGEITSLGMVVTGHNNGGVERKVLWILEDILPGVDRWHGMETARNSSNDTDVTEVNGLIQTRSQT
jgi:hypothetical protein